MKIEIWANTFEARPVFISIDGLRPAQYSIQEAEALKFQIDAAIKHLYAIRDSGELLVPW